VEWLFHFLQKDGAKRSDTQILDTIKSEGIEENTLNNWETAWHVGALIEFSPRTRLGFVYRSVLRHLFEGSGKVTPPNISFSVDTNFVIPQAGVISLYHEATSCLALVFNVGFSNYDDFQKQIIATDNGGLVEIPRRMRDIWHFGIGAQYRCTTCLTLQTGFAYDTSPQRRSFRSPDLPLDTQYRYAVGVLYDWNRCITLGSAFEYANLGSNRLRNPIVQGDFEAMDAYWLNFTINKKF